ncbi:1-acyl-sn-glycerol-3-phosphate acyltransferase [Roseospira marina]|uniref:1-acyl-sn-glycerol-3-phosphate acyltransferase n=1 Tax=Roseospira marina TaxID=140057 RepID=A0A5M6IAS7_9PROT|nr:lysophospholipid acyltransferase family protein [Roseospira marina]KAA5605380.1 1-acyl-sn-glycerol-3-phosphate acyltransferase [Roseospira marina]MBB4314634.1 1-acyl-sn-glycerol-3-phosphate acyltransferase [Roseospira marina]MBB5088761.1 1-acyl-sn-glycerol-3-phosphate acyltransferase [Roseospira marina]
MPGISSPVRAVWRLLLFVLWTLVVVPPYSTLLGLRLPSRWLARVYWRGTAAAIGLRIRVARGRPTKARPLLIVSNHTSYLDIVVLGARLDAGFVAKSEVGTWPGFGLIARLGRTVFVERKRASTGKGRDDIARRLAEGEPLILFPEGTSNDGNRVLPFKSALLAVAEPPRPRQRRGDTPTSTPKPTPPAAPAQAEGESGRPPLLVQPVSLAYTQVDGLPIGYGLRAHYAWYGDMSLAGHLFAVLGLGNATAEVIFHDPVDVAAAGSRKALARHCQALISGGVGELLSGHPALPVPAPGTASGTASGASRATAQPDAAPNATDPAPDTAPDTAPGARTDAPAAP